MKEKNPFLILSIDWRVVKKKFKRKIQYSNLLSRMNVSLDSVNTWMDTSLSLKFTPHEINLDSN